jgi:hypothetical protein
MHMAGQPPAVFDLQRELVTLGAGSRADVRLPAPISALVALQLRWLPGQGFQVARVHPDLDVHAQPPDHPPAPLQVCAFYPPGTILHIGEPGAVQVELVQASIDSPVRVTTAACEAVPDQGSVPVPWQRCAHALARARSPEEVLGLLVPRLREVVPLRGARLGVCIEAEPGGWSWSVDGDGLDTAGLLDAWIHQRGILSHPVVDALDVPGGWAVALAIPGPDGLLVGALVARTLRPAGEEASRIGALWADLAPQVALVLDAWRLRRRVVHLESETAWFRSRDRRHYMAKSIVRRSPAMQALWKQLEAWTHTEAPVAVVGPVGSGKEMIARALHHLGPRRDAVLSVFHARTVRASEAEVELFGEVSSSLEAGHRVRRGLVDWCEGGTLMVDSPEAMEDGIQRRLHRMVTHGEVFRPGSGDAMSVQVRLVASCHEDPLSLADRGLLRADLAHVLSHHVLRVPALSERREDIPELALSFLRLYAGRYGRAGLQALGDDALAWLLDQAWPGNVRELQTAVERAVLHAPPGATTLAPG